MSQENVEITLEVFRLVEAGEFGRLAELMDPEVTMDGLDDWPEPGPFIGSDAVVAELERVRSDWAEQRFEDIQVLASDPEWAVTTYRWHVRGESGLEADFDFAVAVKVHPQPHHQAAHQLEPGAGPGGRGPREPARPVALPVLARICSS